MSNYYNYRLRKNYLNHFSEKNWRRSPLSRLFELRLYMNGLIDLSGFFLRHKAIGSTFSQLINPICLIQLKLSAFKAKSYIFSRSLKNNFVNFHYFLHEEDLIL